MGRGLTGPRRGGKAAAAGLGAGARGKRGWVQLASMSSSLGSGRDALPGHAPARSRPAARLRPPRASRAGPAGFSPPAGRGLPCHRVPRWGRGRMRCPGRSPTAPTLLAPSLPWKGEAGEVPPVGLWPAGAGGKGSWAGKAKESLAFPGLACCLQAGGGCRAPPPSPCAACRAPCQLPRTLPAAAAASAEAGGAVRSQQLGAEAGRVHSFHPSAWLGMCAGACPGMARTGALLGPSWPSWEARVLGVLGEGMGEG